MPQEKADLVRELGECGADASCKKQVQEKYEAISKPRDEAFDVAYKDCKNGNCTEFNKVHYGLRTKLTQEGNEYYESLTKEQINKEFILLSDDKAIFHTFQRDPITKEVINITSGEVEGYKKYVHPIYGYEVVVDIKNNNQIVSDPLNMGTYNFYNPNMGMENVLLEDRFGGLIGGLIGNHNKYDVNPYFERVNAPYHIDPTTDSQRKNRKYYYIQHKKNNIKQKYNKLN